MPRSRLMSLVEAVANVVVGYAVAVATQLIVFPRFGLQASLGQNLAIGGVFTLISLARSYVLRRTFEQLRSGRTAGRKDGRQPRSQAIPSPSRSRS